MLRRESGMCMEYLQNKVSIPSWKYVILAPGGADGMQNAHSNSTPSTPRALTSPATPVAKSVIDSGVAIATVNPEEAVPPVAGDVICPPKESTEVTFLEQND
jgi:hypothetical protein